MKVAESVRFLYNSAIKNLIKTGFKIYRFLWKKLILVLVVINVLAFAAIFLYVKNVGDTQITKYPVRYIDQIGYYSYLPATINNQDLSYNFMVDKTYPEFDEMNRPNIQINTQEAERIGLMEIQEGIYANKYSIGVAVLLAPFYLLAHGVSIIAELPTDGWSALYQYYCAWGALNYLLLAFILLYKFLRKNFSLVPIVAGMIFIFWGTNLFHYSTYENLFSHMFSFSFIAYFIYLTDRWYCAEKKTKWSLLIGLVTGIIILLRQANLFVILYFILYDIENFWERIKFFVSQYKNILTIITIGVITILPLLLYWKYAFGSYIVFSYAGETFNFTSPQITNVLFSTAKGLFFWSPILLFAIPGFFIKSSRKKWLPIIIVLLLQTYLIASWSCWQFGESYGHRAFVDLYPFFLIGIVGLLQHIPKKYYIIGIVFVALNIIQTVQFWLKIIPPADTTWFEYSRTFLKFDEEYKNLWRIERGWE